MEEGERLIEGFLSGVRSLPLDQLSEDEVKTKLEEMREEVLRHDNPYIKAIVSSQQDQS